jgi:hypothetical protein
VKNEASQTALFPESGHVFVADILAPLRFSEALKHGRAMRFRYDKRIASKGCDLFQYLSDVSVPLFGQPPHFLNRVFKNLCHGCIHITNCD